VASHHRLCLEQIAVLRYNRRTMLYAAIGHVCQDVVPDGKVLGGTVTYSTLTARALGWSTAAVTRAGAELDLSLLREVDCVRLADDVTTTFENVDTASGRVQFVRAIAGPIRSADIPPHLRRSDVIHVGPIAGEVDADVIDLLAGAWIGVTPQGWMRQWDASGRVSPRGWDGAEAILRRADAVVLSIDDVAGDWAQIERWAALTRALVVTRNREGCTVYAGAKPTHLAAPPADEVDATGAGDIFAAAFFTRLRTSGDLVSAAQFANCLAARSITRRGLAGIPTSNDIQDCLSQAARRRSAA
jgi:sugar/nucleoside kinase (ribokinase family)